MSRSKDSFGHFSCRRWANASNDGEPPEVATHALRRKDRRREGVPLGTGRMMKTRLAVLQAVALLALSVVVIVGSPVATSAGPAGMPTIPGTPKVLFYENFENVTGSNPVALTSYTGGLSTFFEKYTADPYWLSGADCNGYIVSGSTLDIPLCTGTAPNSEIRAIAYALGFGLATNHSVAEHSHRASVRPGASLVEIASLTPIPPIPAIAANRFITFSLDAASINCTSNHAKLAVFQVDGTVATPAYVAPIDPCSDPRSSVLAGPPGSTLQIMGGHYFSDKSLLNAKSCAFQIRNDQIESVGNDHGFDNIRCWDTTPQLDKSFSPVSVQAGSTATLTFTITNTSELGAKTGWKFTDSLPPGLTVALPPATTTCPTGSVITTPSAVAVTGNLNAGQSFCTVTVTVTSNTAATYANGPRNVTTIGLDPPLQTTITFTPPPGSLKVCKVAGPGVAVGTIFSFTAGMSQLEVPAGPGPGGYCVMALRTFPLNSLILVQELGQTGYITTGIAVAPDSRRVGTPNLSAGSVRILIGTGVTEVTYTNKGPTGFLEICKQGNVDGIFSFAINPGNIGPISIPAGACSSAIEVSAGALVITEAQRTGSVLNACFTIPADREVSCRTENQTSTVTVPAGDISTQTDAIFVNGPAFCPTCISGKPQAA
jgi:uncharacterized repeat protein (TIGR01451 family)